jgi:hypothetical protein
MAKMMMMMMDEVVMDDIRGRVGVGVGGVGRRGVEGMIDEVVGVRDWRDVAERHRRTREESVFFDMGE